jgi:hydrogenase nickel incorporation protein HypB
MVHHALHDLDLGELDILFIENVGNLVCPASFDLGQHINVALLSVTEGDDKPAKYPVMFRAADTVLISKTDLLAVLDDFDPEAAEHAVRALASDAPVIQVSARTEGGLAPWLAWLESALTRHQRDLAEGRSRRPAVQPEGAALHAAGERRA